MFATSRLLEKYGHTVIPFSMQHPLNFPHPYSKYWPSHIDYAEEIKKKDPSNIFKVISRTIYSEEARQCIAKLLDIEKPDLVHIHNILHHLTPSILGEIKKRKIPIVWTLHDYTIICPNTSFLTDRGEICEACKKSKFYMAAIKRCKKNSLGASFIAMLENYIHRFTDIYRHVDIFISPSQFLRKKFVEFGMGEKVVTLNNFMDLESFRPTYSNEGYYIYIGRLSHIKGIEVLVEAAKKIPAASLKIIGHGELLEKLKNGSHPNIELLGFKTGQELNALIANSMFTVVPSQWYENFPYSILESFAHGKPVVGSCIGGIPELVRDHETGLTFQAGNARELQDRIEYLISNPPKIVAMGEAARRLVEKELSIDVHYAQLMKIYGKVLSKDSRC